MNEGEYFFIETENELRQAYEMFGCSFRYSLAEELEDFYSDSNFRLVGNFEGIFYLDSKFGIGKYKKEIQSPLKKDTIENPIKDNRIVSDNTFALRFCGFLDNISVADACSEDELNYLKRVAIKLLTYQYQTATGSSEVDYIKRLDDRFKEYLEKGLTTEDGYTFYRGEDVKLFSCMRKPQKSDDNTIMFWASSILEGGVNPNRVFFKKESNKDKYIEDNLIQYSKKDLEQLIKNK